MRICIGPAIGLLPLMGRGVATSSQRAWDSQQILSNVSVWASGGNPHHARASQGSWTGTLGLAQAAGLRMRMPKSAQNRTSLSGTGLSRK